MPQLSLAAREAFECLGSSPVSSIKAWFLSIGASGNTSSAGISLRPACSSLGRQLVCRKPVMSYFHHTPPLQAAQSDFFHPPPRTANLGNR
ncbi:hypothetical protein MA16_Dca017890 [Dendrobium catenatum]|uniref:Uncharacterized protein n=1 Tax=Dendrobium catenatum TaxID=906689 RepID=A0A2I0W9R6_9ASPA|nr:hypothetical protein MA16_Dca017890 [Dendrobium catenatum]